MDFILGDILGLEYDLISDKQKFIQYTEPKFSYATHPLGDELFYESDVFLYNKDIHPQPINFCEHGELQGFYPVSARSRITFDIFASAFFMLTRYEEYLPGKKDKYDRYRGKESMNFKANFLEKPMIDFYALDVREALRERYPQLQFRKRRFEYIPTFDVDTAYAYKYKSIKTNLGGFMRSLLLSDFGEFNDRLMVLMNRRKDPYDTFDYICHVCKKNGLKSRFFFMVADQSRFDRNISYQNEPFRELIKEIADKTEVGIQLSYKSHVSSERMQKEIKRLNDITGQMAIANRFHYQRFHIPHSYVRLAKIGMREDHTLGYAGRVGFRAGTCTPFPFFNLKHNLKTDFMVYPFAFMDSTFTHYLKEDTKKATEKILMLMQYCKKAEGPLVGLWHNSSFTETKEWRGWRNVFETVASTASTLMGNDNDSE